MKMENRLKVVTQGNTSEIYEIHLSDDEGVHEIGRVYSVRNGQEDLVWQKRKSGLLGFIRTSDGLFLRTSDGYMIRCSDQK